MNQTMKKCKQTLTFKNSLLPSLKQFFLVILNLKLLCTYFIAFSTILSIVCTEAGRQGRGREVKLGPLVIVKTRARRIISLGNFTKITKITIERLSFMYRDGSPSVLVVI